MSRRFTLRRSRLLVPATTAVVVAVVVGDRVVILDGAVSLGFVAVMIASSVLIIGRPPLSDRNAAAMRAWLLFFAWAACAALFGGAFGVQRIETSFGGSAAHIGNGLALILGATAARANSAVTLRWLSRTTVGLMAMNLFVSLAQVGVFVPGGSSIRAWDYVTKNANGVLLFGRPTGFFLNPNDLAAFGVVAAIIVWYARGSSWWLRSVGLAFAVSGVVISSSRGYMLTLAAVMGYEAARRFKHNSVRFLPRLGVGIIAALVTAAVFWQVGFLATLAEETRLSAALPSDPSVVVRVEQVSDAVSRAADAPLGHAKPPQVTAQGSIDNELARVLLLGGVPLMALLFVALWRTWRARVRDDHAYPALGAVSMYIVVSSFSQLALSGPNSIILFLLLGAVSRYSTGPYSSGGPQAGESRRPVGYRQNWRSTIWRSHGELDPVSRRGGAID